MRGWKRLVPVAGSGVVASIAWAFSFPWRNALRANEQWNGEEPLLEVVEVAIWGERGLTEAEVERLTADRVDCCRCYTAANRLDSRRRRRKAG